MKKIDINRTYRAVAIFCAVRCGKNEGKARVTWDELKEKFGINWESYTHELRVNGMLFGGVGYLYLRPEWEAMTPAERMERIKEMYPYPRQENL